MFTPTKEQQNALSARGQVLVSAAAGSGKTAVLVERIIQRVRDERLDITQFLVVTFTNAATAEMRERIYSRLSEEVKKARQSENPSEKAAFAHLRRQQMLLPSANISSIDSFCISLCRENFHKISLPPDFKIAENAELAAIKSAAMDELLDSLYDIDNENNNVFKALLEQLDVENGEYNLTKIINKIYDFLRSLPYPREYMKKVSENFTNFKINNEKGWAATVLKYIKDGAAHLLSSADANINIAKKDITKLDTYIDAIEKIKEKLEILLKKSAWDDVYVNLLEYKHELSNARTGADDIIKASVKSYIDNVKSFYLSSREIMCGNEDFINNSIKKGTKTAELLSEIVFIYWDLISQKKSSAKIADFADIQYAALSMLTNKPDETPDITGFVKKLSEKYIEVLVDEYQDTNDLQNEIFKAVSGNGERLFMVGDVKQSIYRFRNANPDNFLLYQKIFPLYKDEKSTPSRVDLTANFRSKKVICDFINLLFKNIMSTDADDNGKIKYEKSDELRAEGTFNSNSETPDVSFDIIDSTDSETDSVENEAKFIASRIIDMKKTETVSDKNGERPASYSDFAIFLRSDAGKIPVILKVFREQNIPAVSDGEGDIMQTAEVSTLINLLKAIDNPVLDIPLLHTMLLPIYGFTADEIAIIRANNTNMSIFASLSISRNEKVQSFLASLSRFRTYASQMSAGEFIIKLLSDTSFIPIICTQKNAEKEAPKTAKTNITLITELARGFKPSDSYCDLSAFLRYLSTFQKSETALSAATSQNSDAVRVMTIHKSKGLQFPFCFVCCLASDFNIRDLHESFLLHHKSGIGFSLIDKKTTAKNTTIAREAIKIDIKKEQAAEGLRVLYVALTRAQEKLCLFSTIKNPVQYIDKLTDTPISPYTVLNAKNYAELILRAMIKEDNLKYNIINADDIKTASISEAETQLKSCDMTLYNKIKDQLSFIYPYEQINKTAAKRTVTQLLHKNKDNRYFTHHPLFITGKLYGAEKGTAVHRFMQYADYVNAKTNPAYEISKLISDGLLTEKQGQAIEINKIKAFFESEIYKRIERSNAIYREEKFITFLPARNVDETLDDKYKDEKIILQGTVDCAFTEDEKLVIVDYKTDYVNNINELYEAYKDQLELYANALETVRSLPIKSKIIYSLHLNEHIEF